MAEGLDKSGGISFSRKLKAKEKEPYGLAELKESEEKVEEPKRIDTEELLKSERLNAKLSQAKGINYSGFAVNGTTIIGALFYLDSLLLNPDFVDNLNMINDMFDLNINFEQIIATVQGYKAQIIGFAISSQAMIMQYKSTVQQMKDKGNESFYEVFNEELEKIGI